MISVSDKIEQIAAGINAVECPDVESPYCRAMLNYLRGNIDHITNACSITLYGRSTNEVKYCIMHDKDGVKLFGLPVYDEELLKLPKVTFSVKDIKDRVYG